MIELIKGGSHSFRDYFRAVLKEQGNGREYYENLLPMTIGSNHSAKFITIYLPSKDGKYCAER